MITYTLYGVDSFGYRDVISVSTDLDMLRAIRDRKNQALDEQGDEEFYRYFISRIDSLGELELVK
jgi:hypothetical protein